MSISRRNALAVMLTSGLTAIEAAKREEPQAPTDLTKFPRLQGKTVQVLGSVNSFVPPRTGDSFSLNPAALAKSRVLEFDAERKSYIPLSSPTVVESVNYYSNGAFENMRLVSKREGQGRVVIDIVSKPGQGVDHALVWVLVELEVVQGVAMIECKADGKFPDRPR